MKHNHYKLERITCEEVTTDLLGSLYSIDSIARHSIRRFGKRAFLEQVNIAKVTPFKAISLLFQALP